MSITNAQIVEALAEKKLSEVVQLISMIEEKFGVTAAAMVQTAGPVEASAEVEEKTEFDVVLKGIAEDGQKSKMDVIRGLRAALGSDVLGLKEAKEMVEKAPVTVKTGVSKEAAEELKTKLVAAGAQIEIK